MGMNRLFLLVFLLCFISEGFAQQKKTLVFREEIFNFGTVVESEGAVVHGFEFTNATNRPVTIVKVQPSCGCTTPDWTKEPVMPGKVGFIKASFDPRGRPGYFDKSLSVVTDMDKDPIQLRIKGQVVSGLISEKSFTKPIGNMSLQSSSFNMGKVFLKDEYMVKDFSWKNTSEKAIEIKKEVSPDYIVVEMIPPVVAAGEVGQIRVHYNGAKKNQYGFQSDNIELHTNDVDTPVKSISVFATLEEYFPEATPEELAKAPTLFISEKTFDLGRIKQTNGATKLVSISNPGKKPLLIREIQSNCTCTEVSITTKTIKPGDTAVINIVFNPEERKGTQQKSITVYANDPRNPVQRITFSAYVED